MISKENKVQPHKHCPVCGKSMSVDVDFCSDKCRQDYGDRVKRQKRANRLYYVSFGALLVVMVVFFILGGSL